MSAAALAARLPPSAQARVERSRTQRLATLARNLSLGAQVGEILDAAEQARLPLLPIKGALLAFTVYEDPSLRPMRDVDLLVRPRDLDAALAFFATLGFRATAPATARWTPRHAHAIALVDPRRQMAIDLHHRLFHELDADGDVEPLFARAITVELHGRPRSIPAWEHSLFFAAAQGAVDGFGGGLTWLLDLALLCTPPPQADFARAADEARRRRLKNAFSVAVALAHRALPNDVPPPPWPIARARQTLLDVTLGSDPLGRPPNHPRNLLTRLLLADGLGGARELIRKLELRAIELFE